MFCVSNLSLSEYYIGTAQTPNPGAPFGGVLCINCIVLIVDSGVFLPLIGYPSFFANSVMPSAITLPGPQIQGEISTGLNLASVLLFNQTWIGSTIKDTLCIATTVVKAGNYYQGYSSAWASLSTGASAGSPLSILTSGYYVGYTYAGLRLLDFTSAIQFFQSHFPTFGTWKPSLFLYQNVNRVPMAVVSETSLYGNIISVNNIQKDSQYKNRLTSIKTKV